MLKISKWQVNSLAFLQVAYNYIKQEGIGSELFSASLTRRGETRVGYLVWQLPVSSSLSGIGLFLDWSHVIFVKLKSSNEMMAYLW